MSNDRELLELAAKAAGIGPIIWSDGELTLIIGPRSYPRRWEPLTDDGDALRLAVKLCLQIDTRFNETRVFGADVGRIDEYHKNGDPYAATRRAIVRAAAEIGRAKGES